MAADDTTVDTGGEFHLPSSHGSYAKIRGQTENYPDHRTGLALGPRALMSLQPTPGSVRSPRRPPASPTPCSARGTRTSAWLTSWGRSGHRDEDFAPALPLRGQPALAPQLALVTLMQFAEDLTDRQAADAVRGRIDWKYALCLELDDPGFDDSVLCEFRTRLLAAGRTLSSRAAGALPGAGAGGRAGRQRTDSTRPGGHPDAQSAGVCRRDAAARPEPSPRSRRTGCGRRARPHGRSATGGGWRTTGGRSPRRPARRSPPGSARTGASCLRR